MKTRLLSLLLALASAVVAQGQGTVNFSNLEASSGLDAPFFESDGSTRLSGSQFMAELLGGSKNDNLVPIATTGFLSGGGAGYFNGGIQAVPGVQAGQRAFLQGSRLCIWKLVFPASLSLP